MPKQSITTTPDFHALIQAYADEQGLSWSAALVTLASHALQIAPAVPKHGGDRKSPRWQELKREYDNQRQAASGLDFDPAAWQDWHQDIREAGFTEDDFH